MLIEFSIGNYRSFQEPVTLSMVAANLVAKEKTLDENNLFPVDKELKLLKSAAIYGANASGKSNLIKALSFMKWLMVNSSKQTQSTEEIETEPFRLSTETENQPSYFELVFIMDGQKYRYGFEVTRKRVISEWLFYVPKIRETKLFERELDKIETSKKYSADRSIQQKTRSNALFLSVSAQFNVELAEQILEWVTNKLNIISGLHDEAYLQYTVGCILNNKNSNDIIQLIKKLDLGISDIQVEQFDLTVDAIEMLEMPDELKKIVFSPPGKGKLTSIGTTHLKFDKNGKYISTEEFDLKHDESEGTQKVFALAGPLITALKEGEVLIIDEFDTRLHPLISLAIVELFNSQETNPNNAQLIFVTHDTNLLSNKIFRRDQVWFTEKNRYGATDLYSLAEYKIRNDASFESDYIKGKYGAIPYIGNLNHLIDSHG
ncbi:MAG: ATP-binding protein [Oscillatoria sp. PMC 1068.18]|nr:ATP-binding protein [Oscillatoria sp. PMC 1076.18]MEC4989787.1 ATP-binding protein [Oscillatoria sp. PMC 1068.18]